MSDISKAIDQFVEDFKHLDNREDYLKQVFGHSPLVPRPVRFGEIEWDDETSYLEVWDSWKHWISVGHLYGGGICDQDYGDREQDRMIDECGPESVWHFSILEPLNVKLYSGEVVRTLDDWHHRQESL